MPRMIYPGDCARCGKRWGDHLTEQAARFVEGACPFVPKPGDVSAPTREGSAAALAAALELVPPDALP